MREILFRGKAIDGGKWLYGDYQSYAGAAQIWESAEDGKWNYLVQPETVGQYTGMTDKNGKKIFEGDIIKTSAFGVEDARAINHAGFDLFEVNFFDGSFRIENKWRLFNLRPSVKVEVVGNIYDNKRIIEAPEV